MSCYSKEGVDDSSSESNYPNIPDFSQMRVNESNTPANVCKYCYKAFMECGFYRFGDLPALAQHAKKPSIADIEKLDEAIRNCGKLPLPTTPASAKNAKFIRENFTNFPYTLKQQVDYLISIINDRYSDIKTQSSPSDAALWWCRKYERPACVTDRWQRYGKTVTKYLNS